MEKPRKPVFILLPGGGMGAWIWQRVTPLLEAPAITVDERIAAPAGRRAWKALSRATLSDCAAHVAEVMDGAGVRSAVLVAHSGAGVFAPYVARHTKAVRHIVFISANIPPEGGNALDGLPLAIRLLNVVAIRMNRAPVPARAREELLRKHFLNASPEDVVQLMLAQDIRPEPPCGAFERVHRAGIQRVPATYVRCLRDGTLSPAGLDRMIANYGGMDVVDVDADHMVMLSRPGELAGILNTVARRAAEGVGGERGGPADLALLLHRVKDAAQAGADRDAGLQEICRLLHDRVPRYNWVGFYLVDPEKPRELVRGPFVGEPTEHVRIPFGRGVCGQAAERRETVVVDDVSKEANYLSCSVNVKSEIVLPLMKDGEVLGELDIDSHTPNAFTEKDRRFLEEVCRVAVALF